MYVCLHACTSIYAILLQCLCCLLLPLCILVSVVVFLCLSCLLVSCMPLCILVSVVVPLVSCMSACCLFVCAFMRDSWLSLCLCLVSCVSVLSLCIHVSGVVFLCLVCLLAVCLFVLSCVTHDCACACLVCLLVFAPPPCASNSNRTVATVVRASVAMYFGLCEKTKQKQELMVCTALYSSAQHAKCEELTNVQSLLANVHMSSFLASSLLYCCTKALASCKYCCNVAKSLAASLIISLTSLTLAFCVPSVS